MHLLGNRTLPWMPALANFRRRATLFLQSREADAYRCAEGCLDAGVIPIFLERVMGLSLDNTEWHQILNALVAEQKFTDDSANSSSQASSSIWTPRSNNNIPTRQCSTCWSSGAHTPTPSEVSGRAGSTQTFGSQSQASQERLQELEHLLEQSQSDSWTIAVWQLFCGFIQDFGNLIAFVFRFSGTLPTNW